MKKAVREVALGHGLGSTIWKGWREVFFTLRIVEGVRAILKKNRGGAIRTPEILHPKQTH